MLGVLFLVAGGAKIVGAKPLAEQFGEFGLSLGTMRLVGFLEVVGAIGLQLEFTRLIATVGLILMMVGAVANHLRVRHPPDKFVPAAVLGVALALLAVLSL